MDTTFDICVAVLLELAEWTSLTYKQINVLIFCILWPALTILLIICVKKQSEEIKSLKKQLKDKQ